MKKVIADCCPVFYTNCAFILARKSLPVPARFIYFTKTVEEFLVPEAVLPNKGVINGIMQCIGFSPSTTFTEVLLRVSKSHGLMVVQPHNIFLNLCKILRFACKNLKFIHFNLFYSFFLHVSHILGYFW